ncbi:hypothetical protein ACH5RR_024983 [Cinchona calisaya]|uniref:Uncharacterized protein n=1 Tax=Cinchona calisaya TaxID=153742 RepID=A0ABD2YZ31_9GENT
MVRPGANSGPSQGFQPVVTQTPETIDDTPPPFDTSIDENQQENYVPPHQNHQAFPPQSSQPNSSQKTQMRSPPNPSAHQPQAFPPPQNDEPQAFPPPQGQQPQSFPPPQNGEPQAFPPPQADEVHAFPPQQNAFNQQPNIATNYSAMGGGVGQIPNIFPPNSPFIHPSIAHQGMIYSRPITPLPVTQALIPTENWKTGLFGCMDDPTNALITLCLPCMTFGQIAEVVDSGRTSCGTSGMLYGLIACFTTIPCILSCTYRAKIRGRFGIMETPAPDWIIHCCCECCALCQEYRELQKRGLDPSIGWLGNVAKSQQMAQLSAMTSPIKQTMMG